MRTVVSMIAMCCAAVSGAAGDPTLQVRLAADKPAYRHPAPDKPAVASLTLDVKNDGPAPITLRFSSGQRYDFVLYDKAGLELARWSAGRMFTMALGSLTLAPGETKKFTDSLPLAADDRPVPAGDYEIEGVLSSIPPRAADRLKLRIGK